MTQQDLQYPIGNFIEEDFSEVIRRGWINDIRFLPGSLEIAILNLDAAQLDTPYRPGGWTVNQLIHHIADSHINAYCRLKLGLTEERPVIKTYKEKAWSELPDVKILPANISITLLHALHIRWVAIFENMTEEQWKRKILHPAFGDKFNLWNLLGYYSWHGRHHLAHISGLRERMGW